MLYQLPRTLNLFHFDWITERVGEMQDAFSLKKKKGIGALLELLSLGDQWVQPRAVLQGAGRVQGWTLSLRTPTPLLLLMFPR